MPGGPCDPLGMARLADIQVARNATILKEFVMTKFLIGSTVLVMLASCASVANGPAGNGDDIEAVCKEQSDWARGGKVGGGDITITCPGYARPGY